VCLPHRVADLAVGLGDVGGGAAWVFEARAPGGRVVAVVDDRSLDVGGVAAAQRLRRAGRQRLGVARAARGRRGLRGDRAGEAVEAEVEVVQGRAEQFEADLAILAGGVQVVAELAEQRTLVGLVLEGSPGGERLVVDRHTKKLGLVDGFSERHHTIGQSADRFGGGSPTFCPVRDPHNGVYSHDPVQLLPEFDGGEVIGCYRMRDLDDVGKR
jgi:hypothetical protein